MQFVTLQKTLYVCLRAIDAAGNRGAASNAAAVWLPKPPATDRVTLRDSGMGEFPLSSVVQGWVSFLDYQWFRDGRVSFIISGSGMGEFSSSL